MDKATKQRTAALRIPEDLFIIGRPFTGNELAAMTCRGLLRETLPGHYLDTRQRYGSAARARIARHVAGGQYRDGEVFCRATAAWIHGLLAQCTTLNIASRIYRRPAPAVHGVSFEFNQHFPGQDETVRRGQVELTGMLRTVCDMACHAPLPLAVQALERVLALHDPYLSLEAISARLAGYPQGSPQQRGLRLVESMQPRAA